jgi:hypothetical protein|nr:MAG TPA: hypothetical protein [Bacteriophage sp.]
MNYAVGHSFNVDEMFMNFPYKKLKLTCEDCKRINGNKDRDALVKKIFRDSVKVILSDIIDNNVTFILPTNKGIADIHVRRTYGEDFKKARKRGKWKNVDFLSSNFSGNELVLSMKHNVFSKEKIIYVDKNLKSKITENTNNGMQYC